MIALGTLCLGYLQSVSILQERHLSLHLHITYPGGGLIVTLATLENAYTHIMVICTKGDIKLMLLFI